MLIHPTLCGGGGGAEPGFRVDFPTSCPCSTVAGFLSAMSLTRTVPPGSEQPAGLMGADGESRRAGFEGMAYLGYFLVEASPMRESGRGELAFRVTGEGSNPPAEITFSADSGSQTAYPQSPISFLISPS